MHVYEHIYVSVYALMCFVYIHYTCSLVLVLMDMQHLDFGLECHSPLMGTSAPQKWLSPGLGIDTHKASLKAYYYARHTLKHFFKMMRTCRTQKPAHRGSTLAKYGMI